MSATYHIACRDCKEQVWIGQGRSDGGIGRLYHYHQERIIQWLLAHKGHTLEFAENADRSVLDDCREWEIETGKYSEDE